MTDVGKLPRPEAAALDGPSIGEEPVGAALEDPAAARQRAGGELAFRASGGARGVAPMQRLMDQRRVVGAQLATRMQRKAAAGPAAGGVKIPESGGGTLPSQVQARMQPRLGADLSDVQVHTGGESAAAASDLGARAFTVGRDVHFGAGEFAPGSKEGDRLLAHELTHVVQGKQSGVQRKADDAAAGGEHGAAGDSEHGAAGHEVSHPDEPAEKEADVVADGVTASLHGGGDKKAGAKDKDKKGPSGAGEAAHAHDPGRGGHDPGAQQGTAAPQDAHAADALGSGEQAHEKPAPISAKFVGVGRKIMRAEKTSLGSSGPRNATASSATAIKPTLKIDATTEAKPDAPPATAAAKDASAWNQYHTNWSSGFLPKLKENGIADPAITSLAAKKSSWFETAYIACESGKAVNEVVDKIYNEMPKEPVAQEKHFWSGGPAAQGMADTAIGAKGKMDAPAGAGTPGGAAPQKAMRLETSHVGILFNGVFDKSKLDWKAQSIKFWQRASTNYARATTGTVTAHLNVDLKYLPDQKINREAIFGKFELPEIVANMKNHSPDNQETVVKALVLELSIHGMVKDAKGKDANVDKKTSVTIGAAPDVSEKSVLDAIDRQIKAAVRG